MSTLFKAATIIVIEHFSQVHGLIAPAAVADRPATALTQAGADDVAEPEEPHPFLLYGSIDE